MISYFPLQPLPVLPTSLSVFPIRLIFHCCYLKGTTFTQRGLLTKCRQHRHRYRPYFHHLFVEPPPSTRSTIRTLIGYLRPRSSIEHYHLAFERLTLRHIMVPPRWVDPSYVRTSNTHNLARCRCFWVKRLIQHLSTRSYRGATSSC